MMPEPSGNGDECTSIAAGGVCKEMGEVLGKINEREDTRNSKNGATRGKKSFIWDKNRISDQPGAGKGCRRREEGSRRVEIAENGRF